MLGLKPVARPALYPPGLEPIALLGGSFADADRIRKRHNRFFAIADDEISEARKVLADLLPSFQLIA